MKTLKELKLSDKEMNILHKIRAVVTGILPDGTVIFFGSRARGEGREYSDWDILVLTETVDWKIERRVFSALYDIELDEDIIIGPLILPRDEWENKRFKDHPIHERVNVEGVLV